MYVTTSLWETDELAFTEIDETGGYFTEGRDWVEGEPTTRNVLGSLQPVDITSTSRLPLPSGVKEEDARVFLTKDGDLKSAKDFNNQQAATTVIDGQPYFVDKKGDRSRIGTHLRHYVYLLVKSPKPTLTSET